MELRQLRYFVAVCEELSFSRAASRNYLSQSAISHQIARLEAELSVTLFDRSTRRVIPTDAADRLAPIARQMLALEELAFAAVQPDGQRIRLAANMSFANRAMAAIAVIRDAHPDAEVDFIIRDFAARVASVRSGDVDIALIRGSLPESEAGGRTKLAVRRLWSEDLVVVASEKHALANAKSVDLQQLSKYPLLLPSLAQQRLLRSVIDDAFAASGLTVRWGAPIAPDRTAVAELVNHPDAWTILYVGETTPGVRVLPMSPGVLQVDVNAVERADEPTSPLLAELVEVLVQGPDS
ncbi:putative LysR family transcriptional regulator [Gordonia effusa NBRC 100432]|uniref:Putative LysR family transcriptional regulator n=1 Tax=Gordonia effusa NBRC 100432 TaxID=1077974 RepID=H0QXY5_9ACTN|nr:LysR family transcriptional regulator [Gordonia effusa]GAB17686.1 putative LysR family transcriptional regulator [Gordonia effusa NBRC 100432]